MKYVIFTLIVLLCPYLYAQSAYLGIYVSNMSASELRSVGLSNGIQIEMVMPGSPADIHGLKDRNIIYRINNTLIKNENDLLKFMATCSHEDKINVFVFDNGQQHTRQVQLTKRDSLVKDLYIFNYIQNPWLFTGINVEPISSSLATLLKLETGMVILDVRENSIASVQGLEPGDIIISVNQHPTYNEKTLTDALNIGLANQPMQFFIWRDSRRMTIEIDLTNSLRDQNESSNEIFIVGPDIFDNELYSYSKEKIDRLLNKTKSELESDIERLEREVFLLRQRINGD